MRFEHLSLCAHDATVGSGGRGGLLWQAYFSLGSGGWRSGYWMGMDFKTAHYKSHRTAVSGLFA